MNAIFILLVFLLAIPQFLSAQTTLKNTSEELTTVKIGGYEWTTTNLDIEIFRNGDTIFEAQTILEWRKANQSKQPAWCYYMGSKETGKQYGKLYNWYAINDPRGLAPNGFHIPSDSEWSELLSNMKSLASFKADSGWAQQLNGTNSSGFCALPSGMRDNKGEFYLIQYNACWWTSSESDISNAWTRIISGIRGIINKSSIDKGYGLSIRCIKDYVPKKIVIESYDSDGNMKPMPTKHF